MRTTPGQLLVNADLPESLRDYSRTFDKKSLSALASKAYELGPEAYKQIMQHLQGVGRDAAYYDGASFSLDDFLVPADVEKERRKLRASVERMAGDRGLSDEEREKRIVELASSKASPLQEQMMHALRANKNRLAEQATSGARGNPSQLRSLLVGDLLVADHRDRPIPLPILRSYSEGLTPAEYWAGSYGARKGTVASKFSTRDAGAWGKHVAQASHRVVASDSPPISGVGLVMETADPDLDGYVLAKQAGKYLPGTVLTPRIIAELKRDHEHVLVHSAVATLANDGTIPRVAFGLRERGSLPRIGDNVGITAAHALGEPLSQSMLSTKHGGGAIGGRAQTASGFELINNLVNVPKTFKGGATVASEDGRIEAIDEAPQGGHYIYVKGVPHYANPANNITAKIGDVVEAGDTMTDGVANPADLVYHKGIGEGRRLFVKQLVQAYKDNGISAHRRNAEALARGLINHVRVTQLDAVEGALPDDLVEYDSLAARYKPRAGAVEGAPSSVIGKYLERPALHYSIGTRITPSISKALQAASVPTIITHNDPPPFEPEMKGVRDVLSHSPDWMVRFGGGHQRRGLLEAVHRGRSSEGLESKSFIPPMILGEL